MDVLIAVLRILFLFQLEATRVRLAEVLRLWEAYQAALAAANQRLTEMDFSLSRCHSASGDLETFSAQIARLQVGVGEEGTEGGGWGRGGCGGGDLLFCTHQKNDITNSCCASK